MQRHLRVWWRLWTTELLAVLLSVGLVSAFELSPIAVGARGGISMRGESPLGEQMRRDFVGADVFGVFALPWDWYSASGWGVGSRLMTSVGAFSGVRKTAFVTSAVPLIALGARDGTVTIDAGMGGALISAHHFDDVHNLGGPFQFVATLGGSMALFRPVGVGYRFQHYSDGTLFGKNTRGIDLHMIEVVYRF